VTAAACPRCGAALPAPAFDVGEVAVVRASAANEDDGLLAWARVRVGPLELAGLAVRLNVAGEIVVTFPARKDRRGTLHREVTPLDPDLDLRIRAAVIAGYMKERGRSGRRRP
jgi:hypothetical protein